MRLSLKNIFLIDGVGAFLSASLTGLLLPFFSNRIGLPKEILYLMASIGFVYALSSLTFYFWSRNLKKILPYLILANFYYCLLITILLFTFWGELSVLGAAYFLIEMVILLGLVAIENKIYKRISADEKNNFFSISFDFINNFRLHDKKLKK